MAIPRPKCGFWDINFSDLQLMVTRPQLNIGKAFAPCN